MSASLLVCWNTHTRGNLMVIAQWVYRNCVSGLITLFFLSPVLVPEGRSRLLPQCFVKTLLVLFKVGWGQLLCCRRLFTFIAYSLTHAVIPKGHRVRWKGTRSIIRWQSCRKNVPKKAGEKTKGIYASDVITKKLYHLWIPYISTP